MSNVSAYPLQWPEHIARSKARETGRFQTSISKAIQNVEHSLSLFGKDSGKAVSGIVVSSNYTLTDRRPGDSGVAVWFTWDGDQRCIPVDRYYDVAANLQAIHHVLEARRTELRHGTLALVRATFRGFIALPSPGPAKPSWREVFGWPAGEPVTEKNLTFAYRQLAMKRHPDKPNGSHEDMAALNAAFQEAQMELGG